MKSNSEKLWVAFIIALPLSAVLAGLATVYIAFKHADTPVYEQHHKSGKSIIKNTTALNTATELKTHAVLNITNTPTHSYILLSITGEQLTPPYTLYFSHKTQQSKDILFEISELDKKLTSSLINSITDYQVSLEGSNSQNQKWLIQNYGITPALSIQFHANSL